MVEEHSEELPQIDEATIRKCQEGDKGAFHMIYQHFKTKVFSTAFRFTNNYDEAMDLTQDIFINIFKKIKMFEFRSSLSTWIYRLSVNAGIDRVRKYKRYTLTSMDHPDFQATNDFKELHKEHQVKRADENVIQDENAASTHEALQRLSPKLRAILILRYIEDLPYSEIATVLKCSEGTVKSRLNRAHIKLKEVLEKDSEVGR
ncbi:MAG: sigma-70 family RNA polymerase sigma factor [Candidatus Ancaeobacter aquaticus]|nr:sigma-70 family RNA polymerase sigma factor [Candidatus Ancaeobacter aquaticus]